MPILPLSLLAGVLMFTMLAALPAHALAQERFVRSYWFERGIEHANPKFSRPIRVNSPESVVSRFADRPETRDNGLAMVLVEEDLTRLAGAELHAELWGGHAGTAGKRVSLNGRSSYDLPDDGVADGHCAHSHPRIALNVSDLVNGYNAVQFACDQGTTFWGHFIVDEVALRAELQPDHPDLVDAGLAEFQPTLTATPGPEPETIALALEIAPAYEEMVDRVVFEARYVGYDENGSMRGDDWHGFTKRREPVGVVAVLDAPPFAATWDVAMLPAQQDVAVRAIVHFKEPAHLSYETAAVEGLEIPQRTAARVALFEATEMARPFWSRVGRERSATILLPGAADVIERAELHIVIWDGGRGDTEHPFKLNGHPVEIAGAGAHDTLYRVIDIDPAMLVEGENELTLVSDTEHHGIEVLLPGPALMVRSTR